MKKLVMNMSERTDRMKFDDKEFQILTVKNVPPFVSKLFFEDIFSPTLSWYTPAGTGLF